MSSWVLVRRFNDEASAFLARSRLNESGIAARLDGRQTIAGVEFPSGDRGLGLLVCESDRENAVEIIEDDPSVGEILAPGYRIAPRPGDPVFRLRRSLSVAGAIAGGFAGLLFQWPGSILIGPQSIWVIFGAGILGSLVGGLSRSDFCSKPTCRAALADDDLFCRKCGGEICGMIRRPGLHSSRKLDWHRTALPRSQPKLGPLESQEPGD